MPGVCHFNLFLLLFPCGVTKGASQTLVLDFAGHSHTKHACLLKKFPSMGSVTVCTQLRFDLNSSGFSTVFSYSIKSFINEFQLRANLTRGKRVQLTLLVHGIHGPYQEAFDHDDAWHSVCVSWSQNGGRWELFADGLEIHSGDGLNGTDILGADGNFIIGQEYKYFRGSFKNDRSFSGSITELHVWNRVLNSSEIAIMKKECSPVPSGRVFTWREEDMQIESAVPATPMFLL
uniref:Pentraxin family member n=1 Tax=Salarias fasciatus TaxID=181472 RepID=A0A672J7L8_SALFA